MVDLKRIGYLFGLALIVGLLLVWLRTSHIQVVYQSTLMREKQQSLRQDLWEQQALLSARMESPHRVREQVEQMGLKLIPPGDKEDKILDNDGAR